MKLKVLLVEDDEVSTFLSNRLLAKIGRCSKVDVAQNGQEALDYLSRCTSTGNSYPDIILLDVNMPMMDGHEFLDHFVQLDFIDREKTHIVLLSTNPLVEERKDNAVLAQLVKPLTIEMAEEIFRLYGERVAARAH